MVGGKNLLITSRLVQDFFHQPYASKVPYASPVFFSFHPTKLQQKGTGHHEHDAPAPAPFALAKVNEEHTTDVPGKTVANCFWLVLVESFLNQNLESIPIEKIYNTYAYSVF